MHVHKLLTWSGGRLPSAVMWKCHLEGAATGAPSEQVADANGQALASPKCSTFLWFALPEVVETQAMHYEFKPPLQDFFFLPRLHRLRNTRHTQYPTSTNTTMGLHLAKL